MSVDACGLVHLLEKATLTGLGPQASVLQRRCQGVKGGRPRLGSGHKQAQSNLTVLARCSLPYYRRHTHDTALKNASRRGIETSELTGKTVSLAARAIPCCLRGTAHFESRRKRQRTVESTV